jgi:hypothetical protein
MAILEVGEEPRAESPAPIPTETTRLLCAAAYTETTFAQQVVAELVDEDYRAISFPPGVDPAPVIKHCLAALSQKTLRDRLLAASFLLVLVVLFAAHGLLGLLFVVPLALSALVSYWLLALAQKILPTWVLAVALVGLLLSTIVTFSWFGLCFLLVGATVFYDLWRGTYRIVTRQLNARAFDPAEAPAVASPELARRVDEIIERQAGNLTVYSGFRPFVGSGADVGGWSFVVDLRKGKDELGHRLEPGQVEPLDLYAGVERGLAALDMSNLTIEDRVFVNGSDIRDDRALLPSPTGRPSSSVSDDELRRLMVVPTHRLRHYTCIRVTDWRGQLVLSLYLRFAVANGRLFCELSDFLLLPLKPELHRSDGISPEPELGDLVQLAWRALMLAPLLWLRSPVAVLRPLLRPRRRARLLRLVERNAFFDYGATITELDRVRSQDYSRYFQKLDKTMYVKVLERTILDSIVDVLDAHNIDTGEIVERRSTIINNGIMAPGGSVKADNIAVGLGARIASVFTGGKSPEGGAGGGEGGGGANV